MARRILFKEDSLINLANPPSGYKFVGYNVGTFSERQSNGDIIPIGSGSNSEIPPMNYYLNRNKAVFNSGNDHLTLSITGKDGPRNLQYTFLDVDLSKGNYYGIYIEDDVRSLKLPVDYKNNLSRLVLFGVHNETQPIELNLSDYPNLDWCLIREMYGQYNSGQLLIRPNFLITDTVIDFPKAGAIWLGNCDYTLSTEFLSNNLEIRPYNSQYVSIATKSLNTVNIDYSYFDQGQYDPETETIKYGSSVFVSNSPNLTSLTISGLSFSNLSNASSFSLDFQSNNFTPETVDNILSTVDNYFTQSLSMGNDSFINVSNDYYLNEGIFAIGEDFVVGQNYVIDEVISGDDFTNIGYVSPGVEFTATGTTPTNWLSTNVYFGSSFGSIKSISFVSADFEIQDGCYAINLSNSQYGLTFSSGVATSFQLMNHTPKVSTQSRDYIGKEVSVSGDSFYLYAPNGNPLWIGNPIGIATFSVTDIYRNTTPTGGTQNSNYQSLVSKGWNVKIAR